MRADTIDLNIDGHRVRVICEDPDGVTTLRSALVEHLDDEPAPVGFALRRPTADKGMWVLLDRSGFVLARSRTSNEALAVLGSHLAGLVKPPEHTVRVRCRALLAHDASAILAGFPLFVDPPLVERRLERESHRMIDRLAIDIGQGGMLEMSPTPWPELAALPTVTGHTSAPPSPTPIRAMCVSQAADEPPSIGALVAFLAQAVSHRCDRAERLDLAERLATGIIVGVSPHDSSASYRALRELG